MGEKYKNQIPRRLNKYLPPGTTPEEFARITDAVTKIDPYEMLKLNLLTQEVGASLQRQARIMADLHEAERRRNNQEIADLITQKLSEPEMYIGVTAPASQITVQEPWRSSRPKKRDRDREIWEMREGGETWEDIADKAGCGISTAKENYERMKEKVKKSG